MTQRYLSAAALAARYGKSERTIWRWAANGILPRPCHIGAAALWDLEKIEELERGAAERSETAAAR